MYFDENTWLLNHPVFRSLSDAAEAPGILVSYVEGFAPVVNSVPAFLHLTLTRGDHDARILLREIWNDELGLSGTKAHPVLFDELHHAVTSRWGSNRDIQAFGVDACVRMIQLCGSGSWPIGVAAMKAHESQFPTAYGSILPTMDQLLGSSSEFFRVHSYADVEHSKAGSQLLRRGISERVVSATEADQAFEHSTEILRNLMDAIWRASNGSTATV